MNNIDRNLVKLVKKQKIDEIKELLPIININNKTALKIIKYVNIKIFKLLKTRLNINNYECIKQAIIYDNKNIVKYIIKKKLNIDPVFITDDTILAIAIKNKRYNIINYLILQSKKTHNFDIIRLNKNKYIYDVLFICEYIDDIKIFNELINIFLTKNKKITLIRYAANLGQIDKVKLLIKKGIYYEDLIRDAALFNHIKLVKYLLKLGYGNLDKALNDSISKHYYKLSKLLIKKGANINNKKELFVAASDSNNIKLLKLFSNQDYDINKTYFFHYLKHMSYKHINYNTTIKFLLEKDTNNYIELKNNNNHKQQFKLYKINLYYLYVI